VKSSVAEALLNHSGIRSIRGTVPVQAIVEFLNLWDMLQNFQLNIEIADLITAIQGQNNCGLLARH
jgi:hypothetical protein